MVGKRVGGEGREVGRAATVVGVKAVDGAEVGGGASMGRSRNGVAVRVVAEGKGERGEAGGRRSVVWQSRMSLILSDSAKEDHAALA